MELRSRTAGELLRHLQETQDQFATLKFQLANRQSTNIAQLKKLRREIARVKTLLREDQLRRTS
ncbi:MAG: Ribosomal protein [Chloroflexi bacterium]|jgi:large subunit ribosomal protein L29|nr:Ribosomal protein [Chloroflexota bacterium]